jgi:hypothetical protein
METSSGDTYGGLQRMLFVWIEIWLHALKIGCKDKPFFVGEK